MIATSRLGSYCLAIGLMIGGLAALAMTLKINYHFGSGLAVTAEGAQLQGWSSLVVDVMAAMLAIATGVLIRSGHRIMGLSALLLTIAFGAYSLTSAVGFGAAERLSLSEGRKMVAADIKSKEKSAETARMAYVEWLKRTATSRPRDTKSILDATSAEIDKLATVKHTPATLLPDAQAAAIAHLTSIDQERIQLWLVVALAALLVTAKVVGFSFGAYLWPAPSVPPTTAPGSTAAATEETITRSAPTIDMAAERHRRMVARFLREETKPATNGRLTATEVYSAFRRWVSAEGYLGVPTQVLFGRICGEMGLVRVTSGGMVRYPSIAIDGARKEPALAKAA